MVGMVLPEHMGHVESSSSMYMTMWRLTVDTSMLHSSGDLLASVLSGANSLLYVWQYAACIDVALVFGLFMKCMV